jgi:hypothetical protein
VTRDEYNDSRDMSLVAGPGVAGSSGAQSEDLSLVIDQHVRYIQTLDTVRLRESLDANRVDSFTSEKTNSTTG